MKDLNKKLRSWLWYRLVFLADRISPDDAFRRMGGLTVQLSPGKGWIINHSDDGKGVPIYYCGQRTYDEHAYDGYEEANG